MLGCFIFVMGARADVNVYSGPPGTGGSGGGTTVVVTNNAMGTMLAFVGGITNQAVGPANGASQYSPNGQAAIYTFLPDGTYTNFAVQVNAGIGTNLFFTIYTNLAATAFSIVTHGANGGFDNTHSFTTIGNEEIVIQISNNAGTVLSPTSITWSLGQVIPRGITSVNIATPGYGGGTNDANNPFGMEFTTNNGAVTAWNNTNTFVPNAISAATLAGGNLNFGFEMIWGPSGGPDWIWNTNANNTLQMEAEFGANTPIWLFNGLNGSLSIGVPGAYNNLTDSVTVATASLSSPQYSAGSETITNGLHVNGTVASGVSVSNDNTHSWIDLSEGGSIVNFGGQELVVGSIFGQNSAGFNFQGNNITLGSTLNAGGSISNLITAPPTSAPTNLVAEAANGSLFSVPLGNLPSGGGGGGSGFYPTNTMPLGFGFNNILMETNSTGDLVWSNTASVGAIVMLLNQQFGYLSVLNGFNAGSSALDATHVNSGGYFIAGAASTGKNDALWFTESGSVTTYSLGIQAENSTDLGVITTNGNFAYNLTATNNIRTTGGQFIGNGVGLTNVAGLFGIVKTNIVGAITGTNCILYTVPAGVTNSYTLQGYLTVTALSVDVIQPKVVWTDENNNVQTFSLGSSISSTGYNNLPSTFIRAKGGTVIFETNALTTGTGSVTYNTEVQLNGISMNQ